MTDERESHDTGAASGADWALSASGRETAENFIREQTRLARLQADELVREDSLRRWSHRVHHVSDVMKVTFEVSAALIALVVIVIVGATIWSAAHDDSAVIESFKVPPDMARNGLSGDVVANQLLDRLAAMQADTQSVRAPGTYGSNFGSDIRVDIPDTGISIGDAYRYLAGWLGHQTHISGEVFRNGRTVVLDARIAGHPGARFAGSEKNLDTLVGRAAEYIYGQTQPFRYGAYLLNHNRMREADLVLGNLARNGPDSERSWAYADWMYVAFARGDLDGMVARGREAARLGPQNELAQVNAATAEASAGHDEQVLRYSIAARAASSGEERRDVVASAAAVMAHEADIAIAEERGDFGATLAGYDRLLSAPDFVGSRWTSQYMKAADAARRHDTAAARRDLGARTDAGMFHRSTTGVGWNLIRVDFPQYRLDAELGAWTAARGDIGELLATADARSEAWRAAIPTLMWPRLALAQAQTGDVATAKRLIGKTPADCYFCQRVRGEIDRIAGNPAGAAYWFARAAGHAPSVPFADTEWGEMLLRRGDYDGAIAKFALAHTKGPHFADALEMWGEALMQKNRSDLALEKFEEANKYAPRWGRLHFEWGKALLWSGDKPAANRQFEIASKLDLSPQDKSQLRTMEQRS